MVDISVITVTMNHLGQVKNMLDSLYNKACPKITFEVIVVDNCSTDGTVEFIQANYPQVKLIINTEIYGFAKNNNIGFKNSCGSKIAIINPDIIFLPNCIDLLVDYLDQHYNIGLVCPKLLNSDNTSQPTARKFITPILFLVRLLTKGNDKSSNIYVRKYLMANNNFIEPMKIDWAIGAAYVTSRKIYKDLKGFDENFFLYVEDVDFCLRIKKLGKDVFYVPKAEMIHAHNRTSKKKLGKLSFYHLKSMLYYFYKHNLWFKKQI